MAALKLLHLLGLLPLNTPKIPTLENSTERVSATVRERMAFENPVPPAGLVCFSSGSSFRKKSKQKIRQFRDYS